MAVNLAQSILMLLKCLDSDGQVNVFIMLNGLRLNHFV